MGGLTRVTAPTPPQTATLHAPDIHWHKAGFLRAMAQAAGTDDAGRRFMACLKALTAASHPDGDPVVTVEQATDLLERALSQMPTRQVHDVWVRVCSALDGPKLHDLAGPVMEYVRQVYPDGETCQTCTTQDGDRG